MEEFVAAGLYDPQSATAAERRELLEHLLARGWTAGEIIAASSQTIPVYLAAFLGANRVPRASLGDIAQRSGLEVQTLVQLREACGFGPVDVDAPEVPSFFEDSVVAAFQFGHEAFGESATLDFARVLGASVARIVEAARAMFSATMRDVTASELEVSQGNEAANLGWSVTQDAIGALVRERLARDADFTASLLQGEIQVALSFVDLVGSTEWSAAQSPAAHAAALSIFERHAHHLAAFYGARVVKLIGDEAMIVARDPDAACRTAVKLCAAAASEPGLPPARGAVGYGRVTARDGDYFGTLVNLVARASKASTAGGVVVTADVASCLDRGQWLVEPKGQRKLRGFEEPVELWGIDANPTPSGSLRAPRPTGRGMS